MSYPGTLWPTCSLSIVLPEYSVGMSCLVISVQQAQMNIRISISPQWSNKRSCKLFDHVRNIASSRKNHLLKPRSEVGIGGFLFR